MNIPQLGDAIPSHDNKLVKFLGRAVLQATGWEFKGELPNMPKFIIIGAPHTSNWDAFYGFAALLALGIRIRWMAKHTLFPKPLRGLLIRCGGIPVDRTANHGVVEQINDAVTASSGMILLVTPEGTRKRVEKWKTGFYHMAKLAGIPIVLGFIDYSRKHLGFGPALIPTDDKAEDMMTIRDFYSGVKGKVPENFNENILGD